MIYLFSRLRWNRHIPCMQCERATLPIWNQCRMHVLARQKYGTYQCCYKFWLWIFLFCNLFFQHFFSKVFVSKFFFEGFTLDASPFTETKRTFFICFMKNMIYKQAVEIGLSSRVMVRYYFSKFKVQFLPRTAWYTIIFFSESAIFNCSTQIFSRWHLIAKCIKFWLEVDTPIFLYNHSDARMKFVDFAN